MQYTHIHANVVYLMEEWVAFNVCACTECKFFLLVAFVIIELVQKGFTNQVADQEFGKRRSHDGNKLSGSY